MTLQEIITERDSAKRSWKEYEKQALHYKELYITLDSLVRLKGGKSANDAAERTESNGEPVTRKAMLIQVVREKGGMDSRQILDTLIKQGSDIKKQYAYNLLSWLVRDGDLRRKDGKYYVNEKAGK